MNQIMNNLDSSHRALKMVYEELDDDTNILAHFHDPEEDEVPSEQFSTWVFVGIFFSFVACSGVLVYMILCCSRAQEKAKSKAEESKLNERGGSSLQHRILLVHDSNADSFFFPLSEKVSKRDEAFKSNLECRPWSEWGDKTADLTESVSQTENTDSSASDNSDDEASAVLPVAEKPPQSPCCDIECGNKSKTHCRICDCAFENGQPIYQSNNPKCRHEFHQVCADKWLKFQNACPTCNEPYVLHVV